jgi:hypothetical protein
VRTYTGTKEGVGRGKRTGTEAFASTIQAGTAGRFWNNGTYQMRPMRGKPQISVHATGRACDLSYRHTAKHQGSNRAFCEQLCSALVAHAEELGLEMIVDYSYTGGLKGGRVWKCDRNSWKDSTPGSIEGGGQAWADWIHVELSPAAADDPERTKAAVAKILSSLSTSSTDNKPQTNTETNTAHTNKPAYPGRLLKYSSTGKAVEQIQARLGIVVDGKFLSQTDKAVKDFQAASELEVDGIVGPLTWAKLFP